MVKDFNYKLDKCNFVHCLKLAELYEKIEKLESRIDELERNQEMDYCSIINKVNKKH